MIVLALLLAPEVTPHHTTVTSKHKLLCTPSKNKHLSILGSYATHITIIVEQSMMAAPMKVIGESVLTQHTME